MQWFYLASGSIVFFTSVDLLQRVLAVDSKNPRAMAFLFNLFAALIALGIFLFRGNLTNLTYYTSKEAWLYVAIAALMYAVFERYRFKVAKQLDASYFATVLNVSVVVAFIGSVFLYKESLGSAKIIGSLLILFALILVSIGRKSKKHLTVKGLLLGIFISAVLGLGWMLDKKGALYFSADVYNILLWAIPVPLIYLPYIKTGNLISEFRLASWKIVLFGIILLRERENIGRKVFAAILALSGVYLLI